MESGSGRQPTQSGRLLPVRRRDEPAMLKLVTEAEERFGVMLMEWWDGDGAARVLARDDDALLLERAEGAVSLADMARNGRDDEACRVLCAVAARLHAPRPEQLPELIPLPHWFRELEPAAATTAASSPAVPKPPTCCWPNRARLAGCTGDLHHGNVLDFGVRGWLAIDPKPHVVIYQ